MEHEARPPARFSSLRNPKNTIIHPLEYAKTAFFLCVRSFLENLIQGYASSTTCVVVVIQ